MPSYIPEILLPDADSSQSGIRRRALLLNATANATNTTTTTNATLTTNMGMGVTAPNATNASYATSASNSTSPNITNITPTAANSTITSSTNATTPAAGTTNTTDLNAGSNSTGLNAGSNSTHTAQPRPPPSPLMPGTLVRTCPAVQFPYSAIGQLELRDPNGAYVCSGSMVGADAVLTAAHCVFKRDGRGGGKFYRQLDFAPGRYRAGFTNKLVNPFGVTTWAFATIFDTYQTVPNTWQFDWDMAIIRLAAPVGQRTGWLGVAAGCVSASSYAVATAGYAADQPLGTCQAATCSFEKDNCKDRTVYHSCPSIRGQSGSPFMVGKDFRVRGILVGTYDASPTLTLHVAHLMSATSFTALVKWVAEASPVLTANQTTGVAGSSPDLEAGVIGNLGQPSPPSPPPQQGLDSGELSSGEDDSEEDSDDEDSGEKGTDTGDEDEDEEDDSGSGEVTPKQTPPPSQQGQGGDTPITQPPSRQVSPSPPSPHPSPSPSPPSSKLPSPPQSPSSPNNAANQPPPLSKSTTPPSPTKRRTRMLLTQQ